MSEEVYGVSAEKQARSVQAPALPYLPRVPRNLDVGIGLIGCGGISEIHLQAYQKAGYRVVALCSRTEAKAEAHRAHFFPDALVTTDYAQLLARKEIGVVDITTSADVRAGLIEAALRAGKHVLSQKPFVLDLATGHRLVALADELGLKLAVNQNGRWAPHFSWMREAIAAGLIGEVSTVNFSLDWDHQWVVGTPFEQLKHLILSDFAIHWFDLAVAFFGNRSAQTAYAVAARSRGQRARTPFLAHACVEFENGQATFAFNADCTFGQEDRTTVAGTLGTMRSVGPGLMQQQVTLFTSEGVSTPTLSGKWFPDGFHGAMAELLCAIEEDRQPLHSAQENLRSLAVCLAAVKSADTGEAIRLSD